jgi:hypothetical protein
MRWLSGFGHTRVALLVIAAALLFRVGVQLFRPDPVEQLEPFIGKDLRALEEPEQIRFDNLISKLVPQATRSVYPPKPRSLNPRIWWSYLTAKPKLLPFPIESWYLWKTRDQQGTDRLILFQGMHLWMIPGESMAFVFVMSTNGNLLTECKFSTGWRINIDDAQWLEDVGHSFPCLLVRSSPSINGADITSQYYALLDDSWALVRLEDSTGAFVIVNYHNPNHTIGPDPPKRTPEQWELALHSSNPAEILRTLVWLGGGHSDPPIPDAEDIGVEKFEDASLARNVRARPNVRTAVEALTRSNDSWVREAAANALEGINSRQK